MAVHLSPSRAIAYRSRLRLRLPPRSTSKAKRIETTRAMQGVAIIERLSHWLRDSQISSLATKMPAYNLHPLSKEGTNNRSPMSLDKRRLLKLITKARNCRRAITNNHSSVLCIATTPFNQLLKLAVQSGNMLSIAIKLPMPCKLLRSLLKSKMAKNRLKIQIPLIAHKIFSRW